MLGALCRCGGRISFRVAAYRDSLGVPSSARATIRFSFTSGPWIEVGEVFLRGRRVERTVPRNGLSSRNYVYRLRWRFSHLMACFLRRLTNSVEPLYVLRGKSRTSLLEFPRALFCPAVPMTLTDDYWHYDVELTSTAFGITA